MTPSIQAFLDSWVPAVFAEKPAWVDPWFYDYFSELPAPSGTRRYARALAQDLKLAGFHPRGHTVLDAGSGFGVTLACLAHLGAEKAWGIEAFAPMAASSRKLLEHVAPDLPVEIVEGSVHAMPFPDSSVDFIYCYEAISHFLNPSHFLKEAHRVLHPGGLLLISDGNNGANRATVREVHEVWRAFEQGPGNRELHGHRIGTPYEDVRVDMLRAAGLSQDETELRRLAWGTFGRHGDDVLSYARELQQRGSAPAERPPVTACPVDPRKGDHIENLMMPEELRSQLEDLGFQVSVYAHFGGARGPLYAAANRMLRAFSSLTLPYARGLKVVAKK